MIPQKVSGSEQRSSRLRALGPLRNWRFRYYLIGGTVSELGDNLIPVALAFAVLGFTHSPSELSKVLVAEASSQLVFILAGGSVADRVGRRRAMILASVAQLVAIGLLGVLVLVSKPDVAMFAGAAVVQGAASALFLPAAAGMLPSFLDKKDLAQGNALYQVGLAASSIVGPTLAGLLLATVGAGWAFIADAGSFAVSIGMLLAIGRIPDEHPVSSERWWEGMRAGWNAFTERTWVWAITLESTLFNFGYAAYMVLGPTESFRHYAGASTWAAISAAGAAGAVIGGLISSRVRPRHQMRLAIPMAAFFGFPPLALSMHLDAVIVAITAAPAGTGLIFFTSAFQTLIQQHLPEDVLSRVSSYDLFGSLISFPVGLACAGALIDRIGLSTSLVSVSIITGGSMLGLLLVPSVRNVAAVVPARSTPPKPE